MTVPQVLPFGMIVDENASSLEISFYSLTRFFCSQAAQTFFRICSHTPRKIFLLPRLPLLPLTK